MWDNSGTKRLAAILACLIGLAAAGCGSDDNGYSVARATQPRVIPWIGRQPAKAPAHPPLAAACTARQLRGGLFLQGATGSLVGGATLRNVGGRPCALSGWPRVSFAGAAARTARWRVRRSREFALPRDPLADPVGSLRALRPGRSAGFMVFWSNWCGPGSQPAGSSGARPAGIRLRLAHGTSLLLVSTGLAAPRCDAPQAPSVLSVTRYVPATQPPGRSSHLPLRATIAGVRPLAVKPGLRAFRIRRGSIFHYRVALTNTSRRPFRFRGCPAYIEALVPGTQRAYVLNCAPAGTIAPGATVLFAMELAVPRVGRAGNGGLSWELAPRTYEPPVADAAVSIVRG